MVSYIWIFFWILFPYIYFLLTGPLVAQIRIRRPHCSPSEELYRKQERNQVLKKALLQNRRPSKEEQILKWRRKIKWRVKNGPNWFFQCQQSQIRLWEKLKVDQTYKMNSNLSTNQSLDQINGEHLLGYSFFLFNIIWISMKSAWILYTLKIPMQKQAVFHEFFLFRIGWFVVLLIP